jgi:hypothetical protein
LPMTWETPSGASPPPVNSRALKTERPIAISRLARTACRTDSRSCNGPLVDGATILHLTEATGWTATTGAALTAAQGGICRGPRADQRIAGSAASVRTRAPPQTGIAISAPRLAVQSGRRKRLLRPKPGALAMDRCEDRRDAPCLIQKRRDSLRTVCRSSDRTRRRS